MHVTEFCGIYMPCPDSHSQTMSGPEISVAHFLCGGILVLPYLHHCVRTNACSWWHIKQLKKRKIPDSLNKCDKRKLN